MELLFWLPFIYKGPFPSTFFTTKNSCPEWAPQEWTDCGPPVGEKFPTLRWWFTLDHGNIWEKHNIQAVFHLLIIPLSFHYKNTHAKHDHIASNKQISKLQLQEIIQLETQPMFLKLMAFEDTVLSFHRTTKQQGKLFFPRRKERDLNANHMIRFAFIPFIIGSYASLIQTEMMDA